MRAGFACFSINDCDTISVMNPLFGKKTRTKGKPLKDPESINPALVMSRENQDMMMTFELALNVRLTTGEAIKLELLGEPWLVQKLPRSIKFVYQNQTFDSQDKIKWNEFFDSWGGQAIGPLGKEMIAYQKTLLGRSHRNQKHHLEAMYEKWEYGPFNTYVELRWLGSLAHGNTPQVGYPLNNVWALDQNGF